MLKAKGSINHNTKGRQHLLNYILEQTKFLDVLNPPLLIRLFYLKHQITEFPKCTICGCPIKKFQGSRPPRIFGNPTPFLNAQTCSKKHSYQLAERNRKEYLKKTYGPEITNVSQLSSTVKRIEDTKELRYGNRKYNNLEKAKKTNLENHGCEYYFQTKEFQEKSEETKLKHFGYRHQMQCPDIVDGMKERYVEAHGVEYTFQNPDVIKKCKKKYIYNGINFDSGWEIGYYVWLADHSIEFVFHPNITEFSYTSNGKIHHYFPDFLVNGKFIELKNDKQYEKYAKNLDSKWNTIQEQTMQDKFKLMDKLVKEDKLKILKFAEMKEIFDYIAQKEKMPFKKWVSQFRRHESKKQKTTY